MASSDDTPPFRLLLHSRDGCIPHLTPRLLDYIFCQDKSDPTNEDWKSYQAHLILGIAAKDTCAIPVYSTKRKIDGDGTNGKKKRKIDASGSDVVKSTSGDEASKSSDTKKPSGYAFLTPEKSSAICKAASFNTARNKSTNDTNYIHDYLRVPTVIKTMVVPTFSFAAPADVHESKKFISSKQVQNGSENGKQQKRQTTEQQIPKGTQNSVAIDTPHGWQSITPEQYGGAVASLAYPKKVAANDAGAVGLFDHLNITTQASAFFSNIDSDSVTILKKQGLKKITTSLQKCTSWSRRVQSVIPSPDKMWIPINIYSTFLPEHVLSKSFFHRDSTQPNALVESSKVAITGWESLPTNLPHSKRRTVLNKLTTTIQSKLPASESRQFLLLSTNDVSSILAAAKEGVSIIGTDLVRTLSSNGIALVLNTIMPVVITESDSSVVLPAASSVIDLKDEMYAMDNRPIRNGCTCLTCRVAKTTWSHVEKEDQVNCDNDEESPSSFSRAYIHHLIEAKEMLADTLVFVHNLHQMVQLFRGMSEARKVGRLESYCDWIERQL